MKCVASALILAFASRPAAAAGGSPLGKVIELMSDLQSKIIREGEDAQKVYAEFSEWCEDRARDLSHEIKTGSAEVASLEAGIAENSASVQELTARIEDLAGSIATDEADLKAAQEIRAKESADFKAEESELSQTIDMLERAVGILEREMAKGTGAFMQVKNAQSMAAALAAMVQASFVSSADGQRLTALVQSSSQEDDEEPGAPDAAVYESQSGDIVETLHNLLEKAETQLAAARKAETTNLHNYEMLEQSLRDEIRFANKDMAEAKQGVAAASEAQAVAEGELDTTSKELKADKDTKADLHQQCMTRASDFEAETKSRGEELSAIAEAKRVISENTGNAEAFQYGEGAASFVQLTSRADLAGFEVVRMVRDLARKHHSKALTVLAQRVATAAHSRSADPFAKVKGLISDMIERLEEEHAADASHKAYCDKELAETNEKKAEKTTEVEKLSTKIDQMTARSAHLKEEVAELQKALSRMAGSQAEADKIRAEEKEAYNKNKADLEQGLEGVKMALKVLNEYYAKDAAHGSAKGASSGIISLLEVVESDFSKSLAEVVSTEEAAAAAYEQETKDGDIDRAAKTKDVEYKVKESATLDKEAAALSADRSNVQAELDAVLEYLSKIEAQCSEKVETYAERKARRDAELAGLKEALNVLESETALVQKHALRRRFRGSVLKA